MALYGYARVSTIDQDLRLQRTTLKAAGYDVIRAEKGSGSRRDGRTELQVLLDFVQPGDVLIVTRIDRQARSMKDLQDIVHELKTRDVALRAMEQPIDTSTAAGKAFLDMLGNDHRRKCFRRILSKAWNSLSALRRGARGGQLDPHGPPAIYSVGSSDVLESGCG